RRRHRQGRGEDARRAVAARDRARQPRDPPHRRDGDVPRAAVQPRSRDGFRRHRDPLLADPQRAGRARLRQRAVLEGYGALAPGPTSDAYAGVFAVASVAVTVSPSVLPASAFDRRYVCFVAPCTDEQCAPVVSQRYHWKAYVIGAVPVHTPDVPVSCCPTFRVPVTAGGAVTASTGGAATASLATLNAACVFPETGAV